MPAKTGAKRGAAQRHADAGGADDAAAQLAALQEQLEAERNARAQAEKRAKDAEKQAAESADPTLFKGAIGIDLGTTYSCVGVWQNERVEILANDQGNRTTPSYVAFADDERLIGDAAKNQSAMNPSNTIFDAKRLIGRKIDDASVQSDMKHWPFTVISKEDGKPLIEVEYKGETKRFLPEELSAMVLVKMKETAERYLGLTVKKAVVTVPAYFNDSQRHATKDAGAISGMQVLRIINEPTAAAIAYGLDKDGGEAKAQSVLIFDFGGGTFDVTLLAMEGGVFEVKATAGDTHLGGEDLDTKMLEHCATEFFRKTKKDLRENKRSLRRLRTACERAKRALSAATTTAIEIDSLYDGEDFSMTITRAKFEELCGAIFKSCMKPVEQVLKDAKVDKKSVDEIVLVGGSTRIPKIQELVSELFDGKALNKTINPDEAVAYGAAVQAFVLSGGKSAQTDAVLLLDVTPLTCGIAVGKEQAMAPIIPRNSAIPTKKAKIFTTSHDNQTGVDIEIFEGERPMVKDNHLLGKFHLRGIAPAKQGEPEIEVTFDVDANGCMNVAAEDKASGKKNNVTITNDEGRLSQQEIDKMLADAAKFASEDKEMQEKAEARDQLESYVFQMQSALEDAPKIRKAEKTRLVDSCDSSLEWLMENEGTATAAEIVARRAELEAVIAPFIQPRHI